MPIINGMAPYLLQHLKVLAGVNDPSVKITPAGFLKLAVDNSPQLGIADHERLRLNSSNGQLRDIKLWTYSRNSPDLVSETPECTPGTAPLRKEYTLSAPLYAQRTFTIGENYLERYAEDAVQTVALGNAPSPMMSELIQAIYAEANAIVGKMDQRLIGQVTFGKNVTNGLAIKTMNIEKNLLLNNLNEGMVSLLADAQANELYGTLLIAGSGLMQHYELRRQLSGAGDSSREGYKWYYDPYSTPLWGADSVGVFAPGTIGFIDVNRMVGFRQRNYGTYQSFQLPIPIETASGSSTLLFDIELRFHDCPVQVADRCTADSYTIPAGWSVTISKTYGLYQQPLDIFDCGDPLTGTNGSLKYQITNLATS